MKKALEKNEWIFLEWPYLAKKNERKRLRDEGIAFLDILGERKLHFSEPSSVARVRKIQKHADKSDVKTPVSTRDNPSLDRSNELVAEYRSMRFPFSWGERDAGLFDENMPALARRIAEYAYLTRRCLIAVSDAAIRRAGVLYLLKKTGDYTAVIVLDEDQRELWKEDVARYLPDATVHDLKPQGRMPSRGKKRILLLSYHDLAAWFDRLKATPYFTLIVDNAGKMKNLKRNNDAGRILALAQGRKNRFLLADRVFTNSPRELIVPLKITGRWDDLDPDLQEFLRKSLHDPLNEHQVVVLNVQQKRLLRETFRVMRGLGMFSPENPETQFDERTQSVAVSPSSHENWSLAHRVGMGKVAGVFAGIQADLSQKLAKKILVMVHHNDVAEALYEKIAAADIPVGLVYGKSSEEERRKAIKRFQENRNTTVLLWAQGIDVKLDLGDLDVIYFAELINTHEILASLEVSPLLQNRPERKIRVVYFESRTDFDRRALVRKHLRKKKTQVNKKPSP